MLLRFVRAGGRLRRRAGSRSQQRIGFAAPSYTISQTENLVPGSTVQVSVHDVPDGVVVVDLCATGRGCQSPRTTITVTGGSGSAAVPVGPGGWLTTGGQFTTCQESDCYLLLRSAPDSRYLPNVKVPVTFLPSRQLVVDPMLGLRDGQSVAFRGYGLTPGASYSVRTCDLLAVSCGADQAVVVADQGGKVAGTLTVTQAPGQYGACGLPCLVRLRAVAGGEPELTRAYTIRQGTIDSTPQEGLADGQPVTVTGTNLPPTYTGTPRWLATGGWSLAQCESPTLGTQLDLAGAFTKCGVPPGGGTVTVGADGTFTATVQVQATLPRILGGTLDCTTARFACSLTLLRYEQDGTVSRRIAVMSFVS